MLLYSADLKNYVDTIIIPMILISPKYFYIGTFAKKYPYVSDIDITNIIDCSKPLSSKSKFDKIMSNINLDNKNILFNYISCGYDDRYLIIDPVKDLERLINKHLLSDKDINDLNLIISKQTELQGQIVSMQYYLTKYSTIRWTKKEIQAGIKVLKGDKVITFNDELNTNYTAIFHFFVIYNNYYIPMDLALVCDNAIESKPATLIMANRIIPNVYLYMKYNKEYYFMLKGMLKYFYSKPEYAEINRIIEYKYGIYKQLLIQISHLAYLISDKLIPIRIQSRIINNIVHDLYKYIKINDPELNELSVIIPSDSNSKRIVQILDRMYDIVNTKMNLLTKNSYYKYLALLPIDTQQMFLTK
jgi:hypothetical protein